MPNQVRGKSLTSKEYSKAEALYKEARSIQERITGKDDLNYASSINNLGDLYREQENFFKAFVMVGE